jgi:hypothetical protein
MTMIIDGSNGITFPDTSRQYNSYYNFKNRIINGAMVIDQRNNGASGSTQNGFSVDRWQMLASVASKYTYQQNAGSITPPVGFSNYLGVTSSSAYSVGASEIFGVLQQVEGLNVADLAWGTASAATITVSFWVRSSLTGTFGGVVRNSGNDRSYPFSYTISAANTWEYKTITIAGDTTGTWLTTNGIGIRLLFSIGAGSTISGTAGAWAAANYSSATGATSVVGTNGATFYITGVQLEKGIVSTPFDFRPYTTELQLAQRYYAKINSSGGGFNILASGTASTTSSVGALVTFPVTMRAAPTVFSSANVILADGAVSNAVTSIGTVFAGNNTANVTFNGASANLTVYRPTPVVSNNTTAAFIDMSAEL